MVVGVRRSTLPRRGVTDGKELPMATMSRFARCNALVLLTLSAIPADADTQSRPFGSGTAVGATVQWIGTDDEVIEAPAVGLHITSIRRSGLAFDFGLATLPMTLA